MTPILAAIVLFLPMQETPAHVRVAEELVENLKGTSLNVYGGGKRQIDWDARPVTARTVCSSFVTLTLEKAYGLDDSAIEKWIGKRNPKAQDYQEAIKSKNGFERILHVEKLRAGDILAVKYNDGHVSSNGVEDTGHVMIVAAAPRRADRAGTSDKESYFVDVFDSSASGHGHSDTRYLGKGKFSGGIGRGTFRIYVDREGKIAGYAWSDAKSSEFFTKPDCDLVAGRLKNFSER